jgi:hypothetical protein
MASIDTERWRRLASSLETTIGSAGRESIWARWNGRVSGAGSSKYGSFRTVLALGAPLLAPAVRQLRPEFPKAQAHSARWRSPELAPHSDRITPNYRNGMCVE